MLFTAFIYIWLAIFTDYGQTQCVEGEEVCEVWWTLDTHTTMTYNGEPVEAQNGTLYQIDSNGNPVEVPAEEVLIMDGFPRPVVAINNIIPGPTFVAYEGQKIIIHQANNLLYESTTIHWHGMYMQGTVFSDGTPYVSQCPIGPHQSFTYAFTAEPAGTHWYHSHLDGQRTDGLFGALIVKPTTSPAEATVAGEFVMQIGDWYHDPGSVVMIQSSTLSAHIDGRGRFAYSPDSTTETPYKDYSVDPQLKYRFRVIGVAMNVPFEVSVDCHKLTIVATDGHEIEPVEVDSFILNTGERYDFLLTADQEEDNYWIRANGDKGAESSTKAILNYKNRTITDPTTSPRECTDDDPCIVLNCPFKNYTETNKFCINVQQLKAIVPPDYDDEKEITEYFLNYGKDSETGGFYINGNLYKSPTVSAYFQADKIPEDAYCQISCVNESCKCLYQLDLPDRETYIQLTLSNLKKTETPKGNHPIHVHGHSFRVLKAGYGQYDSDNKLTSQTTEVICNGPTENCNEQSYADTAWSGNNIPGLNLDNPPFKDTLMIPAGGYAIIRFVGDNPGKWFSHCHIEQHATKGMVLILNERPDIVIPTPPNFPTCNDFETDASIIPYSKSQNAKPPLPDQEVRLSSGGTQTIKCPIHYQIHIIQARVTKFLFLKTCDWSSYLQKNCEGRRKCLLIVSDVKARCLSFRKLYYMKYACL